VAQTLAAPIIAPHTPARSLGVLTGLASALAFATSGPFLKALVESGWSTGAAATMRMSGAAVVLLPVLFVALRRDPRLFHRHGWIILGFAVTGVVGCQVLYLSALQRMPVAVALLVQYLAPVLLVVWAWARTRQAPGRRVLAGSAVSLAGLVLVIDLAGASVDVLGIVFALGAAISMGAYFVLSERAGGDLPPLTLAAAGLAVGSVISALLCVVGVMPFTASTADVQLAGATVAWFVPLGWVVVIATALAYSLGVVAVTQVGSRVASFVGLSEVLFAVVFAWAILGETPTPVQLLGGAVLVAGVVLVRAGTPARVNEARLPEMPAP
jgi:drug/metabolite transporter (DMT)-like permease